jgi:sulfatase maturation enzyme AslB (radical SAM superfamily)
MRIRTFQEKNYRAFHYDGKTFRIAINENKPIETLAYPEFYDVKVTSHCEGNCSYCYQNSTSDQSHQLGLVEKFKKFFGRFDSNQMPFQIAFGGGEPTNHPEFIDLLKVCVEYNIVPNYTTNGMWLDIDKVLSATKEYCGGVAVSTHSHLNWKKAVNLLLNQGTHTNLHIIIGDHNSIDNFAETYKEFTGKVKYFVLLPLSAQGRSINQFTDWEYLCSKIDGSPNDIAFGANFHSYLVRKPRFNVSLYEPESMSAYLDLETMKVYKSSFSNEERTIG